MITEKLFSRDRKCNCKNNKKGASSFDLQNPYDLFSEMQLGQTDVFLDLGFGAGDFLIFAALHIGSLGRVIGLEKNKSLITAFENKLNDININHIPIEITTANITKEIPFHDSCIDACLLSNVLHGIRNDSDKEFVIDEIYRVLKTGGFLNILECKKEKLGFGPDISIKLSIDDIEKVTNKVGLRRVNYKEYKYTYFAKFEK